MLLMNSKLRALLAIAAVLALAGSCRFEFVGTSKPLESVSDVAVGAGGVTVTCGTATDVPNINTADFAGTINGSVTSFVATAQTDTPEVYFYSKNGQAATSGQKLCTGSAAGCKSAISVKGPPNLFRCQSSGADQTIVITGVR